jgi:hypothetical protein
MATPPAPIVVPTAYESWAMATEFQSGESLPELDPDGDSLVNAYEFLLGTNPLVVENGVLPTAKVLTAAELGLPGSKHYLALSARIRTNREGAAVAAEAAVSPAGLRLPAAPLTRFHSAHQSQTAYSKFTLGITTLRSRTPQVAASVSALPSTRAVAKGIADLGGYAFPVIRMWISGMICERRCSISLGALITAVKFSYISPICPSWNTSPG